jgi:autotransporter-associated beta strand protein
MIVAVLAAVSASSVAFAGNTWDGGGGDNNWGTGANWNPDGSPAPGSGIDLFFGGTTRLNPNNNYALGDDWRSISFNSGAGSFAVTGNVIDLFFKIENNSSALQTWSTEVSAQGLALELNPLQGDLTLTQNIYNNGKDVISYGGGNGKLLTLSNNVQGGGKLIVRDNALVRITGGSTYSGNTEIDRGEFWLGTGGSLGSTSIFVGNGGSPTLVAKVWVSNAGVTLSRPITINSGNLGTRIVGTFITSGTATVSGNVTLNSGADFESFDSGGTVDFTGQVTGGNAIRKTGNGLVILSGNNSYSGGTTFLAGTLRANHANALGTSGNLVFTGGTLQHTSNNTTDYAARIKNSTSAVSIDTNNQSVTYSGVIDSSNSGGLSKSGGGTLTLSGNNAYTGTNTLNAGTVVVNSTTSLGNTANSVTFAGNGTVQLNASFNTARNYTINSGVTGTIDTSTFNQTASGVISGAGSLTKSGNGTLTLSTATNTYAGTTTVTAGSLIVNGTLDTQSSAVTVNSGATLAGSGTINRPVTVNGSLAPGNGGAGTLTLGNTLSISSTSDFQLTYAAGEGLNQSSTTSNDDRVIGITNLTLGGVLNVTSLGGDFTTAALGTKWTIFDYAGTLTGTLGIGTLPTLGAGRTWGITIDGVNTVVNLEVVPEPAVIAGAGLIGLTALKRRRPLA